MKVDPFRIPGPWRGRLSIVARPRGGDWLDDEVSAWRRAGIGIVPETLEQHRWIERLSSRVPVANEDRI